MSNGECSRQAQMKQANSSAAVLAIMIGAEELAHGTVSVKDLHAEGMEIENKQVQVLREKVIASTPMHSL
jgi:histidyl-tRNA synthetase